MTGLNKDVSLELIKEMVQEVEIGRRTLDPINAPWFVMAKALLQKTQGVKHQKEHLEFCQEELAKAERHLADFEQQEEAIRNQFHVMHADYINRQMEREQQ